MNAWLLAATCLLLSTGPLWFVLATSDTVSRLVAFEVFGVNGSLCFVCLAEGFGRSVYVDTGLLLAVMSVIGGLMYARFLERHL